MMKDFRVPVAVFFVAVGLFGAVLLDKRTSRGQSKNSAKPVRDAGVKQIYKSSGGPASPAKRNALLSTELNWTFGGKPQRGWYLYKPLISRLLNTKNDVACDGFASALARWQKKSGLMPSGVLDEETLYVMIAVWQDARLKDRSPAQPSQLLTAPISDFYDPTRAEELRQVERE